MVMSEIVGVGCRFGVFSGKRVGIIYNLCRNLWGWLKFYL